jgi:hypothetical protein
MSTLTLTARPTDAVPPAPPAVAADPPPIGSVEGSLRGRCVAILTPLFTVAAAWLAGVVAQIVPGAHLDQGQISALMVTAATAALGSSWKWLQGWQQHERLVATGQAAPVKPVPGA